MYDHFQEVKNALNGIRKQIVRLEKGIKSGKFTDDALEAANSLRSNLQKEKDRIVKIINRTEKKVK